MTGMSGGTLDLQRHVWYANTHFSFPLLVQGLKRGVSCVSFRRDEPNRITVRGGRVLMSGPKCKKFPFFCHDVDVTEQNSCWYKERRLPSASDATMSRLNDSSYLRMRHNGTFQ